VFITVVIAVDISAANFSGVAIADLLVAISAAGAGLEICFTDKNATHHSPPARLLCAINDLRDAKTDRATTAAPKEPPPACRTQRSIRVQVPTAKFLEARDLPREAFYRMQVAEGEELESNTLSRRISRAFAAARQNQ
jgi:hypothetical protein